MDDQSIDPGGWDSLKNSEPDPGWKLVDIVHDGDQIEVSDVNPWDFEWRRLGEAPVVVAHPQYPSQRHRMERYKISNEQTEIEFAAGEFSNGVWGFFVPGKEN